uniref:Uncharacterized protein n=2 Tax=Panagrolaimus sp. JU765 TaxID=591449 RepID=A0AC34RFS4_9BILA
MTKPEHYCEKAFDEYYCLKHLLIYLENHINPRVQRIYDFAKLVMQYDIHKIYTFSSPHPDFVYIFNITFALLVPISVFFFFYIWIMFEPLKSEIPTFDELSDVQDVDMPVFIVRPKARLEFALAAKSKMQEDHQTVMMTQENPTTPASQQQTIPTELLSMNVPADKPNQSKKSVKSKKGTKEKSRKVKKDESQKSKKKESSRKTKKGESQKTKKKDTSQKTKKSSRKTKKQ